MSDHSNLEVSGRGKYHQLGVQGDSVEAVAGQQNSCYSANYDWPVTFNLTSEFR